MSRSCLFCLLIFWPALAWGQGALDESLRPMARGGDRAVSAAPSVAVPAVQRPVARDRAAMRPLALALDAMRADDWSLALEHARADGPIAEDILRWYALREGRGTARDALAFLERNSDWPGLPYLKEQMEEAMLSASPREILWFFSDHTPRTGLGALALAQAHRSLGQDAAANATLIEAWQTLSLEAAEQRIFLANHGALLAPHHSTRLDTALWNGWRTNPQRMQALVSEDEWALAEARMALRRGNTAGPVPATLSDHPGLAYERFRQLKGSAAQRALLARSTSVAALGKPEVWAPARRPMARQLMRSGDLEWLSGYLALRLGRPEQALAHFERFASDVVTPISVGRAGYWLGRAHSALGQTDAARQAYRRAARYQTSFYGLLAAEEAGLPFPDALRGVAPVGDWRTAPFTRSSVHQAAVLFLAAGETWPAERFWTHLAESQDANAIALMGKMLEDLGQPHIQVMLGKRAAQAGLEIAAPYYALHPLLEQRWSMPTELVLAIARRESEFDPDVESHAGALGLMQLMPGTARDVAADLGLPYSKARLTADPAYNAGLGTEYLRQMALRYDGNPVLISIAYNAGPSRADRWQDLYGSPMARRVDIVDWIEGIPFRETRNYVMRVTESLPVYRARLGKDPLPQPFSVMLKSSSLRPGAIEGE